MWHCAISLLSSFVETLTEMLGKVIFIGLLFSGALGEPEWLTKLKQKTPQCLPAIQDRIFGGKTAELNEFPSIALIEYTKCKF